MKSSILSVVGLAATVVAQSAGDLPQCGQTCAGNMISAEKSSELGCDTGDLQCLCTNQNFIYGLRDCSRAICNEEQAAQVLEYGLSVCRQAGVAITTGASGSVSATPTVTGIVRTVLSTIVSGDSTIVSAVSTISAAASETEGKETVSTYTSVFTNSDGDVVTTTGETTIGAASKTEDKETVSTYTSVFTNSDGDVVTTTGETTIGAVGAQVTTFTSGGTKIVSTLVTKTATGDEEADVTTITSDGTEIVRTLTTKTVKTGSATETEDSTETGETGESSETGTATGTGEASETTSTGNAAVPQMTAAPAGVLAAAGLAMLLL
ncbi:hypothetical protein LRP88_10323 [Fusarium phalaenopsidis]